MSVMDPVCTPGGLGKTEERTAVTECHQGDGKETGQSLSTDSGLADKFVEDGKNTAGENRESVASSDEGITSKTDNEVSGSSRNGATQKSADSRPLTGSPEESANEGSTTEGATVDGVSTTPMSTDQVSHVI